MAIGEAGMRFDDVLAYLHWAVMLTLSMALSNIDVESQMKREGATKLAKDNAII